MKNEIKLTVCNVGRMIELNKWCGPSLYVSQKSSFKKAQTQVCYVIQNLEHFLS